MIVHIISNSVHATGLIEMLNEHFNAKSHLILVLSFRPDIDFVHGQWRNVVFLKKSPRDIIGLYKHIRKADKIIFHGLFSRIGMILVVCSGACKKTYCALWGGDIYSHSTEGRLTYYLKRAILTRAKGIIMEMREDYMLAKKWYGAICPFFSCMLYRSNIVNGASVVRRNDQTVMRLQVGNSGDSSNRHIEILETLKSYADADIHIEIPLSYGNYDGREYQELVCETANRLFPGKVTILKNFMSLDDYLKLQQSIDVGVFAHRRQQGIGNIYQLISMGAKVYIRSDVTTYHFLKRHNISVFPFESVADNLLEKMEKGDIDRNIRLISELCSEERLISDWKRIFDD